MDEIARIPLDALSVRERSAYQLSVSRKEPFLSPVLADQLYRLFESGKTCEEIQAVNKGITLGTIVRARVDFGWDEKRNQYFQSLCDRAKGQAKQLVLESVSFLSDFLSAFHRHDKDKFARFIQTGDPKELDGAMMADGGGLKLYQNVVALLLTLTGQESTKTIHGVVEHHHTVEAPKADKPLTSEEASALLLGSK